MCWWYLSIVYATTRPFSKRLQTSRSPKQLVYRYFGQREHCRSLELFPTSTKFSDCQNQDGYPASMPLQSWNRRGQFIFHAGPVGKPTNAWDTYRHYVTSIYRKKEHRLGWWEQHHQSIITREIINHRSIIYRPRTFTSMITTTFAHLLASILSSF